VAEAVLTSVVVVAVEAEVEHILAAVVVAEDMPAFPTADAVAS
jgi:hypothetical protein